MLRVLDLTLSTSRKQLLRSQRAMLTITVRELSGITAPVTLTVVNTSPAAVQVDNIERSGPALSGSPQALANRRLSST
jgi:hypothetical protein